MQYDKHDYKTPKTDWPLLALNIAGTLIVCALLYAPPSVWLAWIRG